MLALTEPRRVFFGNNRAPPRARGGCCCRLGVSQVDGFSSDTSVEFEDLMASRNLQEMKEEVGNSCSHARLCCPRSAASACACALHCRLMR